jgi:hypothetical protein
MHFSNKLGTFHHSLRLLILFFIAIMLFTFCAGPGLHSAVLVHTLVGGGGQHGGFNALDYNKI